MPGTFCNSEFRWIAFGKKVFPFMFASYNISSVSKGTQFFTKLN